MIKRQGFTMLEMIVVLIIIGIVVAFCFPNFTPATEQAKSLNAWNNLLAIYSAERNYYNNNNGAFLTASPLSSINSLLSLNIQDDGSYSYVCNAGSSTCTATRSTGTLTITVTLNTAIQLNQNAPSPNPVCSPANSSLCPL